ncbi:MAG: hypothetical protein JSV94_03430 [Methanobacteriota archaeon]|nr:MAG: hypothetical protein JSV94_03430 [Euryarchaeota archaeon]
MPAVRRNRLGTIKAFAKVLISTPRLCIRLTISANDRAQNPTGIARSDAYPGMLGIMKIYTTINKMDAAAPIIKPKHPEQSSISPQTIL